jgi:hypothetical protein
MLAFVKLLNSILQKPDAVSSCLSVLQRLHVTMPLAPPTALVSILLFARPKNVLMFLVLSTAMETPVAITQPNLACLMTFVMLFNLALKMDNLTFATSQISANLLEIVA